MNLENEVTRLNDEVRRLRRKMDLTLEWIPEAITFTEVVARELEKNAGLAVDGQSLDEMRAVRLDLVRKFALIKEA